MIRVLCRVIYQKSVFEQFTHQLKLNFKNIYTPHFDIVQEKKHSKTYIMYNCDYKIRIIIIKFNLSGSS
jgi:hypothetical protein